MEKKIVLLIEDEQSLIEAITYQLKESGYEPVSARSCDEALEQLDKLEQIDVVWLDHYLLGTRSGLDFLVALKKHPKWSGLPVFLVSNTAGVEAKLSYLELGVNKAYVKADTQLKHIVDDISEKLNEK